jgi:membrane fusion protein (multidrug efflux system)
VISVNGRIPRNMKDRIMTIDGKNLTMNYFATKRVLPLILFATTGIWGCGGAEAEGSQEEDGFIRVINVEVESVVTSTLSETIRLTGTVKANQDVTISAEESGVVREILVEKGSRVREGQAIFRLDSELLLAQVDQANALSAMAGETWERRKRLYEEDQVGSELLYLQAKYASEQAAANSRLMEARLERTVIRAPIDGILESREIEVGTMVGVGTPVARIVDVDLVKITAGVPERYAAEVRSGADAVVTFDVLSEEEFPGTMSFVGAAVNPRNRTFPVELVLPNPGGFIKPEMVADVALVRVVHEDVIVVPQEAMVRTEEGYVVFVVEEEAGLSMARSRMVELGATQENHVIILSGLMAGDRLIVVGQQAVADQDHVNVVAGG